MQTKEGRKLPQRILLVDDDPDTLETVGQVLRVLAGAEVTTAASGTQALSKLATARPEALVTDYRMPDMDGIELTSRVHRQLPHLPVVMITAFNDVDLRDQALEAGVCDVVPKPLQFEELVETIGECCEATGA